MMGRACHIPAFGTPTAADDAIVDDALRALHILDLRDRIFPDLSGGQQRLAMIARALAQQAQILVMDEPSSDLDYANQQLVEETIRELQSRGYGILLSTHAPEYPYSIATKALLLKDGTAVTCGPPDTALTAGHLTEAFGVPMDVISVTDAAGRERKMCLPL